MACTCAPSLRLLQRQVDARWPGRDRASDGCCGDAAHAARRSDHNPVGGYAHALDIDADLAPGVKVDVLLDALLADDRTKYIIRNARLRYPDGTNKPYSGVNAHRHHLHISIKANAAKDMREWRLPGATPMPAPPQEDDVTPDQANQLATMAKKVDEIEAKLGRMGTDNARLKARLGIADQADPKTVQPMEGAK